VRKNISNAMQEEVRMGVVMSNDAKPGTFLEVESVLYQVVEYNHVNPGKGGAFVRLKLRNLRQGTLVERTFNSGMKLNMPEVEEKKMQYSYQQGSEYIFMDQDTYEQHPLSKETLGDAIKWLKEDMVVEMLMYNGETMGIEMPPKVELKITQTMPGVRGNTVNNASKDATVETGAVIQVPMFIEEGTVVRIDTRTGEYLERVVS
jgi:elongation factor P